MTRLGLNAPATRTLVVRRFVMDTVGHKCRAAFETMRREADDDGARVDFDAESVVVLCSVLRYAEAPARAARNPAPT